MSNSRFIIQLVANIIFLIKRRELESHKVKFLVFTGTAGKTTMRDAVAFGLRKAGYDVESNNLGYSNEIGVLLTTLGISEFSMKNPINWLELLRVKIKDEKFACIELGADFRRDILWFIKKFTPFAVFISGISEKDWTGGADNIFSDRKNLLEAVSKDGFIVYNFDDPPTKRLVRESCVKAKKIDFSLENNNALIHIKSWSRNIFSFPVEEIFNKKEFIEAVYKDNSYKLEFDRPIFEPQIYAILAAVGFMKEIDNDSALSDFFSDYKFAEQRLQFYKAKNGAIIIEDSYKATPLCLFWILNAAADIKARKKIIVATEMRPLAINSNYFYGEFAKRIHFADKIYFLGPVEFWRRIADINKKTEYIVVTDYSSVAKQILEQTSEKDLIIIKGSFRYELNKLIELLV